MASGNINIQSGGGGGAVSSVFTRTGDVVGIETDYPIMGQLTTVNRDIYVDGNRTDSYTENGSIPRPYKTIQAALAIIPTATDSASMRRIWHIHIASGTYDESISIDIGRKKVLLLAYGAVSIGTFGSSNWAPSGTTRNITITCSLTAIDSIRTSFGIVALGRIQAYGTHQAYSNNFRVSGSLIISNSTGGTSGELNLQGVTLFGWDGVASGNNDSITAGSWAGNLNLYADNCRFYGLVTGGVVRLQGIRNCAFEKLATVATYSQIWFSEIKAGMTWTVAPTEVSPALIACSELTGTFTGGSGVNLLLDSVSDYFFKLHTCTLAGGAVKILINGGETAKTWDTPEGGQAIKLTNKTGAATVKGYLAKASSTNDNAVTLCNIDDADPIGVFYESGIADGQECWIVKSGIADVYYSDSTVRGYFARNGETGDTGATNGMAFTETLPVPPLATDSHFREIGHCIQTRTGAGLAKTVLHFN